MGWTATEKLEFKKKMELRTKKFAVSVFRFLDALPNGNSSRIIAHQLGKSASSVGANYREANRCESVDDFVHKIGIVQKECSESQYWLEVVSELRPDDGAVRVLAKECDELVRVFQSVLRKIRRKSR